MSEINARIHPKKKSDSKSSKSDEPSKAFTWERTIDAIAKEFYQGDWNKVTKMNIYAFNHRVKYMTQINKEKAVELVKQRNKRRG